MNTKLIIATVLLVGACSVDAFGTHLTRTYLIFREQPLTAANATAGGWTQFGSGSCDPILGYTYAQTANNAGPSASAPVILSYTANGQLNGFGVRVWSSSLSAQLEAAGYWRASEANDGSYDLLLTTRGTDPNVICGGEQAQELIGNQLNIWGSLLPIAMNQSAANEAGWVTGDCIPKMGVHNAYDLNSSPSGGAPTWNWQSLVPIQPMYDAVTNQLNAVLINIPQLEDVEPFGEYEGPFINSLFCKNWCPNTGCGWSGVTLWSTLHFHFVPIDSISCTGAQCVL